MPPLSGHAAPTTRIGTRAVARSFTTRVNAARGGDMTRLDYVNNRYSVVSLLTARFIIKQYHQANKNKRP